MGGDPGDWELKGRNDNFLFPGFNEEAANRKRELTNTTEERY